MAQMILNKVQLGYDEHVCLKSLWQLMILSKLNIQDAEGNVDFVSKVLATLADDSAEEDSMIPLKELEEKTLGMLRYPTLADAEEFFNYHFKHKKTVDRLYNLVKKMEETWVRADPTVKDPEEFKKFDEQMEIGLENEVWTPDQAAEIFMAWIENEDEEPLEKEQRYWDANRDDVSNKDLWDDIHNCELQSGVTQIMVLPPGLRDVHLRLCDVQDEGHD